MQEKIGEFYFIKSLTRRLRRVMVGGRNGVSVAKAENPHTYAKCFLSAPGTLAIIPVPETFELLNCHFD